MEFQRFRIIWVFGLFGFLLLASSLAANQDPGKADPKKDAKSPSAKKGNDSKKSDPKKPVEDDPDVAERKAELIESFKKVLNDEPVIAESKNILLLVPKSLGKKAPDWVKLAEKHRELTVKILKLDEEEAQETKLGIFLWANAEQLKNHIRRVDLRSAEKDDTATINSQDWVLRAAGIAPGPKEGVIGDHRAGELVAGILLGRHAKRAESLPEWLTAAYGRATTWKLAPQNARPLIEEKRKVALLSRQFNGWQVLSGETGPNEAAALQASGIYYMAFMGNFASKFPKFIEGYQPDENNNTRALAQILEYAGIDRESYSSAWKSWAGR